jgi:hypothetical protein
VVASGLEAVQTSVVVVADGSEEGAQAPTVAALVRARLAVSGQVIVVVVRLVSSGSLANGDGLASGAC